MTGVPRDVFPSARVPPSRVAVRMVVRAAMLSLGLWATAAAADYLVHAVGEQARLPLPESLDGVAPQYLLELDWSYRGGRSTIEVRPVEDATGSAGGAPVAAIRTVVAEALRRTGRFDVSDGESAGEGSTVDGHVLQVTVATYRAEAPARVVNPRSGAARRPQAATGNVALRMRLADAAGTVLVADRFDAVVERPRSGFAGHSALQGLPPDVWRTPVGQALLAAVNRGTFRIVNAVGPLSPSGRVVKAEEGRVWVNLGSASVAVGDALVVAAEGDVLVDPETGLSLGGSTVELARLNVVEVQARFSVAETVSATGTPSRGDSVTLAEPPARFEFAPLWDAPGEGEF